MHLHLIFTSSRKFYDPHSGLFSGLYVKHLAPSILALYRELHFLHIRCCVNKVYYDYFDDNYYLLT